MSSGGSPSDQDVDAAATLDLTRFRPNVGIVLARHDGKVWLGRRADTPGPRNWQFPQGGVDEGESLEEAARRELHEETGARSVSLLGRTEEWLAYRFPEGYRRSKAARGWLGQKQIWFAFRFTGDDGEFDLARHHQVEFDRWRWADLDEALDSVADFKRETYRHVIEKFRTLIVEPDDLRRKSESGSRH
ncbi:MAG: pyrophosphohydrolase [Caulobacteraceae bacterium]|nr:pyrophosphohydrolase [Caulobacteraceae bacterium]